MSQGRRHKALSKTGRREGERDKKGNFQSKHNPRVLSLQLQSNTDGTANTTPTQRADALCGLTLLGNSFPNPGPSYNPEQAPSPAAAPAEITRHNVSLGTRFRIRPTKLQMPWSTPGPREDLGERQG